MGKWFRDKHGKLKAEHSENVWINGPTGHPPGIYFTSELPSEEGSLQETEGRGIEGIEREGKEIEWESIEI